MKIVTLTLDKVHIKKERHKRRCRNQKHTYSHTRESHKNTKLRAIYTQRTGAEPYRPCACCVSLCDFRQLCSVDLEGLFSWCLLSLLALRLFLLSLSLASEGSDLLQAKILQSVFKSLSFSASLPGRSLNFSHLLQEEACLIMTE